MTADEIIKLASNIKAARANVGAAEGRLGAFNAHSKVMVESRIDVKISVRNANGHWSEVRIDMPVGLVQQHLINELRHAKAALAALESLIP